MGFYVDRNLKGEPLASLHKHTQLVASGAEDVAGTKYFPDLVCVVSNGSFDAAGWCFSEDEYAVFRVPDGRPKRWCRVGMDFLKEQFGNIYEEA